MKLLHTTANIFIGKLSLKQKKALLFQSRNAVVAFVLIMEN